MEGDMGAIPGCVAEVCGSGVQQQPGVALPCRVHQRCHQYLKAALGLHCGSSYSWVPEGPAGLLSDPTTWQDESQAPSIHAVRGLSAVAHMHADGRS